MSSNLQFGAAPASSHDHQDRFAGWLYGPDSHKDVLSMASSFYRGAKALGRPSCPDGIPTPLSIGLLGGKFDVVSTYFFHDPKRDRVSVHNTWQSIHMRLLSFGSTTLPLISAAFETVRNTQEHAYAFGSYLRLRPKARHAWTLSADSFKTRWPARPTRAAIPWKCKAGLDTTSREWRPRARRQRPDPADIAAEKKLLPTSVVNQVTKARALKAEEQQGYQRGRKQMKEIKERVIDELLPKAFDVYRDTRVWIDPVNHWLVIDAAASGKADEVLGLLAKSSTPSRRRACTWCSRRHRP
jgi:hypothetical protein